jgi:hypothetical protein
MNRFSDGGRVTDGTDMPDGIRFRGGRRILMVMTVAALTAACSGAADQESAAVADTLTRAQRDSVIGASSLPGAGAVQRAIDTRDTADARNAAMDSLLKD